ncbi:hypothetical protein [Streptomyces zhihengii]|uniref:hypothetical protein n=1 Tax=Streptomyces zhihengii TaxID=1818004 RepID=UPI0033B32FFA
MSGEHDYSAASIRKTVWGKVFEQSDGWRTVWMLEMDSERVPESGLDITRDADLGFTSRLSPVRIRLCSLEVFTNRPAMSGEYYSPTFRSFRIVNDKIGEIEKIEGLPRDWYAPFRDRGRGSP